MVKPFTFGNLFFKVFDMLLSSVYLILFLTNRHFEKQNFSPVFAQSVETTPESTPPETPITKPFTPAFVA
jgi:hypothetical protein